MIICHCKAITDRDVRRLQQEEGVRSPGDVARTCRAGTVCGGCVPALKQLLTQNDPLASRGRNPHAPRKAD